MCSSLDTRAEKSRSGNPSCHPVVSGSWSSYFDDGIHKRWAQVTLKCRVHWMQITWKLTYGGFKNKHQSWTDVTKCSDSENSFYIQLLHLVDFNHVIAVTLFIPHQSVWCCKKCFSRHFLMFLFPNCSDIFDLFVWIMWIILQLNPNEPVT